MKIWWIEKGWSWLKSNWWVLLLSPLMAFVAFGMTIMRVIGAKTVIVDPTAAADERARIETETRVRQLEEERNRLALELAEVTRERDQLRKQFEQRLANEVQALRDDPEKLRQAMLEAGKPRRGR
jgi:flagellar basal body-associated protein FliL